MLGLNVNEILKYLRSKKYDAELQKETGQIYIILKISGKEFPLFIRVFDQSRLLQLLAFMPTRIKSGTHSDLARLLHHLNKDLDIPGFGMDENAGVAFYRCMIPALEMQLDEKLLDSLLKSIEKICETITQPVLSVASGKAKYADFLKTTKIQP